MGSGIWLIFFVLRDLVMFDFITTFLSGPIGLLLIFWGLWTVCWKGWLRSKQRLIFGGLAAVLGTILWAYGVSQFLLWSVLKR